MFKRMAVVIALTLLASACHKSEATSTPFMPSNPPAGPPPVLVTLAGTVTNATSGMPIAGAGVFLDDSWTPIPAGADGRYQIPGLPNRFHHWVYASVTDYAQPCAADVVLQGDTTLDLQLVPVATLAASSAPGFTGGPGTRTASGVVYRTTATGREPVPGAFVAFSPIGDAALDPVEVATTVSDVNGRYALCGLPAGERIPLFVWADHGDYGFTAVDAGAGAAVVDITVGH